MDRRTLDCFTRDIWKRSDPKDREPPRWAIPVRATLPVPCEAPMSPAGELKTDAERTLDEAVNRAAIISSDAAAVHEAFGAFVRGFDLLRELKDPRAYLQMIATVLHAVRDRSLQLQEELDNRSKPGSNFDQV
jgi:hypothetical protein